jgi:precorrin-6B methylase 2
MQETRPDPSKIMQIGMGFFASKTLLSAVELGVFEVLGAGPLSRDDLRNRLALHRRGTADFLDALVALGLLNREGDGADALYANTADTAAFLNPASPLYLGGILRMANSRLYHHWGHLTDALRTGLPQSEDKQNGGRDFFGAIYADPQRLAEFLDAMAGRQLGNFIALADTFDFGRFTTICDVGGAGGALSIAIARRHQSVRCISYDLPEVTAIARMKIEAAGLSEWILAQSGNFLTDDLPSADIITMGNILHDWDLATKEHLIRKAYTALPEGGAFIVIENIIDDARRANASGLLMSLNMLVQTPGGYNYSFAQFDEWCRAAGFHRTEQRRLAGEGSAAIAWK